MHGGDAQLHSAPRAAEQPPGHSADEPAAGQAADGSAGREARRPRARPFLIAGYALGVPGTLASYWIVKRRSVEAFAALELGMALIVTGWIARGGRRGRRGVVVNALGLVAYAAWWKAEGRRRWRSRWTSRLRRGAR